MPETTPLPATEETSWQRFFRKSVEKFMGFSTFRKLFVGLSILAIPIEVSAAYWEQTRDVLYGAEGVISWLVLAAINAALFFWVWEELTELKPVNRRVALALLGVIVIVFFRREIRLTTEAAETAALASETKDGRDSLSDVRSTKVYAALQEGSVPSVSKVDREPRIEKPSQAPAKIQKQSVTKSVKPSGPSLLPPSKSGVFTVTQTSKQSTRVDAEYETQVVIQTTQQFQTLKLALGCDKAIIGGGITSNGTVMGIRSGVVEDHPNIFLYSYEGSFPPFGPEHPLVINLWSKEQVTCNQVATF